MDGACGTHEGDVKFSQNFILKTWMEHLY